jgi:hypothetical protein
LTGKDVACHVLNDLAFLVATVARELRRVLKNNTNRYFVASGGGDQIVQTAKIHSGQLVK